MKDVCVNGHNSSWVDNFYVQYDGLTELYYEKFAKPGKELYAASMMGPDCTHWHGTYEVAKHFYIKMIPELEHLIEKNANSMDATKAAAAANLQNVLDDILATGNHKWFLGNMDEDEAAARKKVCDLADELGPVSGAEFLSETGPAPKNSASSCCGGGHCS